MSTIIDTERLVLRPQGPVDVDRIVAGLSDFEVTKFLTVVPFPYARKDAEAWTASLPAPTPDRAVFSIDLTGRGMIGTISYSNELGFWLARPYWGRGYMTEAARALLAWRYQNRVADTARSSAHVGNERSLRLQRKLGFVENGTSVRFVVPQQREILHIETVLTRAAFAEANGGSP